MKTFTKMGGVFAVALALMNGLASAQSMIPGGGDMTNSGGGSYTNYYGPPPDYGTNLWIAQPNIASGNFFGVLSNSQADVQYEILTTTNFVGSHNLGQWVSQGLFLGSETTNWTPLSGVPASLTKNLFLQVRSWIDSDDVGIPDWWQLEYFGYVGVNPYSDPAGDGWTILQKYNNGWNPTNYYTPPILQGVYTNASNSTNTLISWISPEIPPATFTIQENSGSGWMTVANVAGNIGAYVYTNPPVGAAVRVKSNYSSGSSDYTSGGAPSTVDLSLTMPASVITGPGGRLYLSTATPSTTVTGLVVTVSPFASDFPKDGIDSVASQYPYTDFYAISNDITVILSSSYLPSSSLELSTGFVPPYGLYQFSSQTSGSNGFTGNTVEPVTWADATPFLDGRQHMLDNLNFVLRAAPASRPFDFYFPANLYESAASFYGVFPNYTTAGFSWAFGNNDDVLSRLDILDQFLPFENDSVLRAFCFDTSRFDAYGNPLDVGYDGYFSLLPTMNTWDYYFNALAYVQAGNTNVPIRQLASTNTQFIFYGPASDGTDVPDLGMTWDDSIPGWRVSSSPTNVYGLPILTVLCVQVGTNPQPLTYFSATPGETIPAMGTPENPGSGWLYVQAANPVYENTGFHFIPENSPSSALSGPGWDGWTSIPNTNMLPASVGAQTAFNLWTQLIVSNATPGTVSYIEDYFDKAYQIDSNGLVTANQTGVLSEYGDFFPTAPGPVALVTKPDLATGQSCTGIVQVISLALDANHDGTIDPTFAGSDYTSADKPYVFWANNNYDRWTFDSDDGTNYQDSVQVEGCPYTPNEATADCNYRDQYGNRVIPDTRDLEDFTRLCVFGVTTNLLAALPSGSTVTLNWGDVGTTNSANPTIDVFQATDADGGMEYLTNEASANTQINPAESAYVGRLGPGQSLQLNSSFFSGWVGNNFIWCGVSNGTGGLNLTIADGSGNILAQSTVYIKITDIKQMYERWTVGEVLSNAPASTASLAADTLPPSVTPFQYPVPQNNNTPYILYVHGWNMEPWEKDSFAETAFKRLYWQGYQGRFGVFRWPTGNDFTGDYSQLISNPSEKDNYDDSEFNAWLSGHGLLNKLINLNTEYPGHVYVLAHSMGNVVTGEALRLAGDNQVVNTYAASQAAITAHTYDETVTNYSFDVTIFGVTFSLGPNTPNIYGNWLEGNIGGGAGRVVSLYNASDYALSRLHWQLNQLFKPDTLVKEGSSEWQYFYNGSASDPAPWNNFSKTNLSVGGTVSFDIVGNATNRYEVTAYAAQSYTTALGATPDVGNLTSSLNLQNVWPSPDPLGNNYGSHFFHSAQFRGDTVWEWNYWNNLLYSSQAGFNISNP